MTRNEIIKHYKDFFDLHAKGIALDEDDHTVIDWAEDLIKTMKKPNPPNKRLSCELERWFYSCPLYNLNKGCSNCEHFK